MKEPLESIVRDKYGKAVEAIAAGGGASCCGSSASCAPPSAQDPITRDLYSPAEVANIPERALAASFGCGNPTALIDLRAGERVLDLGAGAGLDVLLSARRVGPSGRAFGLDMTPQMLDLARQNQRAAGVANAEFLQGSIEAIPLPDASIDVVISNCVINLAGDKSRVFAEAFRVLRPGGRFAVADIVLRRALPDALRASMELWTGCVAGALEEREYAGGLARAGFVDVTIEPTRTYTRAELAEMAAAAHTDTAGAAALEGAVMSAFIRARKP